MELSPLAYVLLGVSALLVGVGKTGLPGIGILITPLAAWATGDVRIAAGAILPLLLVGDLIGVVYFRREAAFGQLVRLIPGTLAGIAVGALMLARSPPSYLRIAVGIIVVLLIALQLLRRRMAERPGEAGWPDAVGHGVGAGFATTVANAAGPVISIYLLRRQLTKDELIGTGAWFFLCVNAAKLFVYVPQQMITRQSLVLDALLVPAVFVGAVAGRWLAARLSQKLFEALVLILAGVAGVGLLFPR